MIAAPFAARAAVVLAVLAAAWLHGCQHGAAEVRTEWQAERLAAREAQDAAAEADRLRSRAASGQYEARRAAIAARATKTSQEVRDALNTPICRPLGASAPGLRLGELAVPAAVVDRLRDAGSDY